MWVHLVEIQKVGWEKGDTESAHDLMEMGILFITYGHAF
jgi:hypothetical protein